MSTLDELRADRNAAKRSYHELVHRIGLMRGQQVVLEADGSKRTVQGMEYDLAAADLEREKLDAARRVGELEQSLAAAAVVDGNRRLAGLWPEYEAAARALEQELERVGDAWLTVVASMIRLVEAAQRENVLAARMNGIAAEVVLAIESPQAEDAARDIRSSRDVRVPRLLATDDGTDYEDRQARGVFGGTGVANNPLLPGFWKNLDSLPRSTRSQVFSTVGSHVRELLEQRLAELEGSS